MTTRPIPQCGACARWVPGIRNGGKQTCTAYPDVIPDDIWWNRVDHRQPQSGDHGLQWQSRDGAQYPEEALARSEEVQASAEDILDTRTDPITAEALTALGVLEERVAGKDVNPGDNNLKRYWTKGPGLRKWLGHPHEWTALRNHLLKYVGPERADRIAAEWFHEVKGFWPGSDLHRVEHGKPPRGKRVGPG